MKVQRLLPCVASALVAVVVSGCSVGTSSLVALLSEADSLASYGQPMRALALLDSVAPTLADVPQPLAVRHAVLYIKARDKACLPLPPPDSLAVDIVKYYGAHMQADRRHRAEGYYYAGRVFRELGDAPQAFHYFRRVVDEVDGGSGLSEIYPFTREAYSQMGYINENLHAFDLAEEDFRLACLCEESYPACDTVALIISLKDLSCATGQQGRLDEAMDHLQRAVFLARCTGDTLLAEAVDWEVGNMILNLTERADSVAHLQSYAEHYLSMRRRPTNVTLAQYYFDTGVYDSAWYYCELIQGENDVLARRNASRTMTRIALARGNLALAKDCYNLGLDLTDTLNNIRNHEAKRLVQASYNCRLRERENDQLTLRNQTLRQHRTYYFSGFLLLLSMFGAVRVHAVRARRELNQQKAETRRILSRISAVRQVAPKTDSPIVNLGQTGGETGISDTLACEGSEATSVGREDNAEALRRQEEDLRRARYEHFYHTFFLLPIGKTLEERIDRQECLTSGEIKAIEQVFEQYQPTFLRTLKSIHRFNQTEWLITLLVRLCIKPSDIAILSSRSKEAVSAARRRLDQKVLSHDQPSPAVWDDFVSRL